MNSQCDNYWSDLHNPWWPHQMEAFSALLVLCVEIHRWPVNSPHKGQWCRALMFSLICAWTNVWVTTRHASDLRCHRTHNDRNITLIQAFRKSLQYIPKYMSGLHNKIQWKINFAVIQFLVIISLQNFANPIEWDTNSTLTHWGRDKMDAISQTTSLSAFSWAKMFKLRLKFHWNLFLRVQLTIIQHCFR